MILLQVLTKKEIHYVAFSSRETRVVVVIAKHHGDKRHEREEQEKNGEFGGIHNNYVRL